MSQIIPPPYKVNFPEELTLSDRIDGQRSDVAASEKAVGLLNKKSASADGAIALVAFVFDRNEMEPGKLPPNALTKGNKVKGVHLREVFFTYGGTRMSPQSLAGEWQCLSLNIEEGGLPAWGLVRRIDV